MKTFKELQDLVIKWGEDRDLYHPEHGATESSQILKFIEEAGELAQGILKDNISLVKDSIGDCQVVLINLARLNNEDLTELHEVGFIKQMRLFFFKDENTYHEDGIILATIIDNLVNEGIASTIGLLEAYSALLGFKELECLNSAYEEIKDRKGKIVDGTFVKDI